MTTHLVHVDPEGTIFRGVAVPYNESALIVEKDGRLVAEQFDEESIVAMPKDVPLLVSHNRGVPAAGIVVSSGISRHGLAVEGRLVGSDAEIQGWRRRFEAGIMTCLSVGFAASGTQEWRRPERQGAPPIIVRRGVQIVEISLVQWPAYLGAAMVSLNARTAASEESQRIIADAKAYLADVGAYLAGKRGR